MSDTHSNFEMTGTLLGQELRKRNSSGKNRHYSADNGAWHDGVPCGAFAWCIQPRLLFKWNKQYQEGNLTSVAAGENVVPASELDAAIKQIRELQRLLGKKTMKESYIVFMPKSNVRTALHNLAVVTEHYNAA
ncbi:transposase InsC for insertion element IS2I [Escherichia coli]|nr:transposase InsC for insertion element IS2I [Escherichia coli]OYA97434.1 transposase InsC for insertion element IS2F [Escherichia coli]OYB04305.1 transposase InsC for insertion element IS2I [Escherichia coli]